MWVAAPPGDVDFLIGKYYPLPANDQHPANVVPNLLVGGPEQGVKLTPVVDPEASDAAAAVFAIMEMEMKPASA